MNRPSPVPTKAPRSAARQVVRATLSTLFTSALLAAAPAAFAKHPVPPTHKSTAKHAVKTSQRAPVALKRVSGKLVPGAHIKRVSSPSGRHHTLHRVAFSPSRTPSSEAFALRDPSEPIGLRSSIAYVVDAQTDQPLIDKNSRAVVPIASISKLMTAMVTLDAQMPMTDTVMVTDADRDFEKGTGSRLSVGSRLSREDMLHIALMSSENRAAAALSRYYAGGRPAFIEAMNRKAAELGMTDTHFEDPTGLNSHNVSSARDLVKMVRAAYQYPLIRNFSTDVSYDVDTGRARLHYGSTNALIRNHSWEIGLQKTGFINEAGECLVMRTTIEERPVVIVLLDSTGKYSRFGDAQRVRNWLVQSGTVQRLTSAEPHHAGT